MALVWGNFSIIKMPIKPNLLPNFKRFYNIFEDLGLFSSLQKLLFPQEVGTNEKNLKLEKKLAPIPILKLDLGFGS